MSELHILLCPWDVMTVFPQTTCQGRIMTSALRVRLMDLWSPQCVRRLRASGVVSSAGFLTSVIWKQDELRVSSMLWNSPNVHFGIVQILSKCMENYCFIGPVCADTKVKYYIENEWQLLTERVFLYVTVESITLDTNTEMKTWRISVRLKFDF